MLFRPAIYALPQCYMHSSAMLSMPFSTFRVILQQIGENAASIKGLIISGFGKSPNFAIFSVSVKLFHFKGSICVKKHGCSRHFCPKRPHSDKNLEQ
jgi:hypothetical protein